MSALMDMPNWLKEQRNATRSVGKLKKKKRIATTTATKEGAVTYGEAFNGEGGEETEQYRLEDEDEVGPLERIDLRLE
jgi:hypothetical protein